MSRNATGTRRSRPCRAHSSSSIRRAVAQTPGNGLGAVAVLPAGIQRQPSETVGPTAPGGFGNVSPLSTRPLRRDRQVARPFLGA